jgi:hypothetical protein
MSKDGGASPDEHAVGARPDGRSAQSTWRRPALALVTAVAVVAAAVVLVTRVGDRAPGTEQPAYSGPLPPVRQLTAGPPDAVGSVSGVDGTGCRGSEDCAGGQPARLDLSDLGSVEDLPWPDGFVLDDGRSLESTPTGGTAPWGERAMPEWWLVDPANGTRLSLGPGFLETPTALPDGRIASVWTPLTDDGTLGVRIIDAEAQSTTVDLPEGFQPSRLAAGPEGWFAVLGTTAVCCPVELVLVGPEDAQRRLVLPGRDGLDAGGGVVVTWGAAGYLAVSPQFPAHPDGDGPNWLTIVDPRSGTTSDLDGWLGTAWSPDGTALLAARPSGADASTLALLWGRGFTERTELSVAGAAFTPHDWDPPAGG